jgi:hypothetical protein
VLKYLNQKNWRVASEWVFPAKWCFYYYYSYMFVPYGFFFDNCDKIYYPQQEAAKMDTELRSTWSRAWNKVQIGPHRGLVQSQFWNVSMELRACFAKVSVVVFWFRLILKRWVCIVAAILVKTCVNGLILHWGGFCWFSWWRRCTNWWKSERKLQYGIWRAWTMDALRARAAASPMRTEWQCWSCALT